MNKLDLKDIYKPTPFTGEIMVELPDLQSFIYEHRPVDMNPPYQRSSVWTLDQREAFMGHLLSGGEIMPIIIQCVPDGGPREVLDGKQRLETMLGWMKGQWGAILPDGRRLMVTDLPLKQRGKDKVHAGLYIVKFTVKFVNLPFEERKQFYVRFNSAGTPHSKADIEHALSAQPKTRSLRTTI